jgi:hypothetical protein
MTTFANDPLPLLCSAYRQRCALHAIRRLAPVDDSADEPMIALSSAFCVAVLQRTAENRPFFWRPLATPPDFGYRSTGALPSGGDTAAAQTGGNIRNEKLNGRAIEQIAGTGDATAGLASLVWIIRADAEVGLGLQPIVKPTTWEER